jgi:hypothetical protein
MIWRTRVRLCARLVPQDFHGRQPTTTWGSALLAVNLTSTNVKYEANGNTTTLADETLGSHTSAPSPIAPS